MTVSARTVIERQTTGMELALVMDNTGSMWNSDTATNLAGTPFEAMRDAALNLVDIIYGEEDELDNVWVSLVPYVAAVNIGPCRTGWLDAARRPASSTNPTTLPARAPTGGGWKGCVMARAYPWDTDDSTPVGASVHLVLLSDDVRPTTTGRRRSTTPTPAPTRRGRDRTSAAARRSRR